MLIAIDHGNKQIKTVHTQPFTSGLIQGDTPGFGTDCLAYQGKYYTLTDQRIPYRRDKTEDERFFILTLFAIAYEIEAMGRYHTGTVDPTGNLHVLPVLSLASLRFHLLDALLERIPFAGGVAGAERDRKAADAVWTVLAFMGAAQ